VKIYLEELLAAFNVFYRTVLEFLTAHSNFFHNSQRFFSQLQLNQTDPKTGLPLNKARTVWDRLGTPARVRNFEQNLLNFEVFLKIGPYVNCFFVRISGISVHY
jgi:hypothetical protein